MRIHNIKIGLILIVCAYILNSCKKDKDATGDHSKMITETPIQNMITEKYVVDTFGTFSDHSYENGLKVTFKKRGNITKLGCYMPTTGKYTVTFWDFASQKILAATTIHNTDNSKFAYNAIAPIEVNPYNYYVISVNNNSEGVIQPYYYFYKKSNNDNKSLYPFTTGNVICELNLVRPTENTLFPNNIGYAAYRIYGIADFVFEHEE